MSSVTFSERLWPSVGVWLVAPLLGFGAGAIVWPFGPMAAATGFVVVTVLLVAALVVVSPRIAVADGVLTAGRARIELAHVGQADGSLRDQARHERGPGLDARAFLVVRGWIDPVVKIEILDEADPTPYWLVSTRQPVALVSALTQARG